MEGAANLTLSLGARYDLDLLPSASDLRILGKMNPTNFGNIQPRVGIAYGYRNGKGVVRANFGIYTGSLEYSSLINGWHGASPFTHMNQPLLPDFADPANDLVGFGPAGMVGTAGPPSRARLSRILRTMVFIQAPQSCGSFLWDL